MFSRRALKRMSETGFNSFITFFPQEFPCRSSFPAILIVPTCKPVALFLKTTGDRHHESNGSLFFEKQAVAARRRFLWAHETNADAREMTCCPHDSRVSPRGSAGNTATGFAPNDPAGILGSKQGSLRKHNTVDMPGFAFTQNNL